MDAMTMEQVSFGAVGPADYDGKHATTEWVDSFMNALRSDIVGQETSPHSSYVEVSPTPTHSSHEDSSLSSQESSRSSSMRGGSLSTNMQPVGTDSWFDFAPTTMHSSGGISVKSTPGGVDHLYSNVHQQFSDPQMSRNVVSGSNRSHSTNDGSVASSRVTASPATSISNYGGSPLPNSASYMNMKPAGDYQYRQDAALIQKAQAVQQRQQQTSTASWNSQSQQRDLKQHSPSHIHLQLRQQEQRQQINLWQLQQFQQQHQATLAGAEEDSGLRLVQLLIECAQSIQRMDLVSAESSVMKINQALAGASQQAGPMSRVAAHFAEALTNKIYGQQNSPNSQEALIQQSAGISQRELSAILHSHFYETSPYLKFAHFTANQAILEAFKGAQHVHVIDFDLNHGLQWPALIQALALRPGGPPVLRLTGIGPEVGKHDDSLQQVGVDLTKVAESLKVKFEFRGVGAHKLNDIKMWMLQVRPDEVVAVNSMMQLHKLLYAEGESPAGIDEVLRTVKSLKPRIVTMSEHDANHNSPIFLDRFMEALHFYSSMFDSLEASKCPPGSEQLMLAEMYLGREICNIVACEGKQRLERHETLVQWRIRMRKAGFLQIHMGPNASSQASALLTMCSGPGYRVQDDQGCLTLCWHNQPLIAASAWHSA